MNTFIIILEAIVVLGSIFLGVRAGGIGLGLWGGVGVAVLVFIFRLPPGSPPIDVILIILTVILAASAMQAAGGIDYLVGIASDLIRQNPRQLIFVAPFVSFLFTIGAGTGNIFFPLIPVIYDVAYENNIRPERALAVSCVASQAGIVCSPVSAAMAVMVATFEPKGYSIVDILLITIPASIVAILVASLVATRVGKELVEDEEYKRRLAAGEIAPPATMSSKDEKPALPRGANWSAWIFLLGVVVIITLGLFSELRPAFPDANGKLVPLNMTVAIQIIMLVIATVITVVCKVSPKKIMGMNILSAGVTAIIALFGVAWVADTFVTAHLQLIVNGLDGVVEQFPIFFAVALFFMAALTTSQAAASRILMPVGLALGIAPVLLIAMWPAASGNFFLPANGAQLAAVSLDETGSTRIGKYVLNHSFMLPTLIVSVVSVLVAIGMATLLHGL